MTAIEIAPSVQVLDGGRTRPTPAGPARWSWESAYVRALVGLDLLAGAVGAVAVFQVEMGTPAPERFPLFVLLLFPFAWLFALVCGHAYDARFLFVGNDEYQAVFRASIGLAAAISIASFLVDTPHARLYVLDGHSAHAARECRYPVRLPPAPARVLGSRRAAAAGRRGRPRAGRRPAVAASCGVSGTTDYGVVGACLPSAASVRQAVPRDGAPPVYGTFDDVASAVRYAGADTVLVLSCPELDGARLRRLAWQLETDDIDLIVASTLVDVAGDRTTIRPGRRPAAAARRAPAAARHPAGRQGGVRPGRRRCSA